MADRELAKVQQDALTKAVPTGLTGHISQEDWDAMPESERRAAVAFFREEQQETLANLEVSFPRIKFPTSGSAFWEVPTATGDPIVTKEVEGVVIAHQPVRAYWPVGAAVANNPPVCSSPDGVTPVEGPGRQARACLECPHAQFGTGKEGVGQACKNRINAYFLMDDKTTGLDEIPSFISVPPSQIRAFAAYAVQVRKDSAFIATTTIFGLTDATSSAGIKFKALTLRKCRKLAYKEMVKSRKIADAFLEQMLKRGYAVAAEPEPDPETIPAQVEVLE